MPPAERPPERHWQWVLPSAGAHPHPTHIPAATQCGRGPSPLISYAATQLCVSCYLDSREAGWASRPGFTGGPTSFRAESGGAPSSSPGGEGEPSGEVGPFLSSSLAASLAATARSVHPGEMTGRAPRPEVSDSPRHPQPSDPLGLWARLSSGQLSPLEGHQQWLRGWEPRGQAQALSRFLCVTSCPSAFSSLPPALWPAEPRLDSSHD